MFGMPAVGDWQLAIFANVQNLINNLITYEKDNRRYQYDA